MNDVMHGRQRDKQRAGPRFGLPKPVPILVAHLLLNIKKNYAKSRLHCVFNLSYINNKKKRNPDYSAL